MPYIDVDVENENGYVNITRFEPDPGEEMGRVGISPGEGVVNGHDVFSEQAFVNALWALYPDGLPPRVISEEEAEIQRLSLIFLNGFLVDAGTDPFKGTYQEADALWHHTLVQARKAAKGYVTIKNDEG